MRRLELRTKRIGTAGRMISLGRGRREILIDLVVETDELDTWLAELADLLGHVGIIDVDEYDDELVEPIPIVEIDAGDGELDEEEA